MSTTFLPVKGRVQAGMNLGSPFFGGVFHDADDLLDGRDQVHRAAHALDHLAWDHPVGDVAICRDFHRAKHGQDDMLAMDHGEAVCDGESYRGG